MDKVRKVLLVCFCLSLSVSNGDEYDEEQMKKASLWEWQKLRSAYSAYRALFPSSIGIVHDMLKNLVNHAYARFFPPNIDFRREDEDEGGKVGEPLARSLGTGKATLEDAAETLHNVKTTFSHSDNSETEPQNKL